MLRLPAGAGCQGVAMAIQFELRVEKGVVEAGPCGVIAGIAIMNRPDALTKWLRGTSDIFSMDNRIAQRMNSGYGSATIHNQLPSTR